MEETNNTLPTEETKPITPTKEILPSQELPRQNNWNMLATQLFNNLPVNANYQPPMPLKFVPNNSTNRCLLIAQIYNLMVNATDTYSSLLNIAPEEDLNSIKDLRLQMQILTISLINIGQNLSYCNFIPLRLNYNKSLPSNYLNALNTTYFRVYKIYNKTLFLYELLGANPYSTQLLIIINNLKSQLYQINTLIQKNS